MSSVHKNYISGLITAIVNKRIVSLKMFSLRIRAFQGMRLPVLIIFGIFSLFLISQYSGDIATATISYPLQSTVGILQTAESATAGAREHGHGETRNENVGSDELHQNWYAELADKLYGFQRPKPPRWTYKCSNDACRRREANADEVITSMDVCWLTCGSHGSVWPFPTLHKGKSDTIKFLPDNIKLGKISAASDGVQQLIQEAFQLKRTLFERFPGLTVKSSSRIGFPWPFGWQKDHRDEFAKNIVEVSISCNSSEEIFTLKTSEEYEISIEDVGNDKLSTNGIHLSVFIYGQSFFGVRNGLETLSQLIALDASKECLHILRKYFARDKPAFGYRGLLIDSARNFVPLKILRRVIDGMSYNKLNILHLHLSDSNSFTFYSKRVPQMTQYGALSEDQIYSPSEMTELVRYARIRGVKIIPELDAPSHAGNGWQFGKKFGLGDLAFYVNKYNDWNNFCGQPPCGILNPTNMNTYDTLENLYVDMLEVFDKDLFHMGGDEVNLGSWGKQPELKEWIEKHKKHGIGIWKFFQTQAFDRLRKHSENITAILWTSGLTAEEERVNYLKPSDYIIQVWESHRSGQTKTLLNKGFSLIISFLDKFYLDWGEGTWLGQGHDWPYKNWQVLYDTKILSDNPSQRKQILGAEAPLWSEKTGPWQIEIRLWPRAAAFAENLWSNPKKRNEEVYTRLSYQNYRMQQRGIPTSQLQPLSCLHFNGHCKNPHDIL